MEENSEAVLTDVSSSRGTQAYDVNISVSFFFLLGTLSPAEHLLLKGEW